MANVKGIGEVAKVAGTGLKQVFGAAKPSVVGETVQEVVSSTISKEASAAASTCGKSMVKPASCTISDAGRWSKPPEEYILNIVKDSKDTQIPYHANIHSENREIRAFLEGIENDSLTSRDKRRIPITVNDIYNYDKDFSQLTPLEKDCIVYRGRAKMDDPRSNVDFGIIEKAKPGDVIVPDKAYSYTAVDRGTAIDYVPSPWSNCESIMYTIRLPKGAKVSRSLRFGGEVLMPRGAEYRLISKTQDGNRTNVILEYLMPTKDNVAEAEALAKMFNIQLTNY